MPLKHLSKVQMQSTIYDKVFPVLEATLSQIDYIPFEQK